MKTFTLVDISRESIKSKLGFGWSVQDISKQNVKTILEERYKRIVEPLDLPNLPKFGKEIFADLESEKI